MGSTTLPLWPPAPLSEDATPPEDPEFVRLARDTVVTVIAKFDKASDTTTKDRTKHPTAITKLTTARGRVYRALHKLRSAYITHIYENAIADDEIHLAVTARNLAALQLIEELDADIQALFAEQLRAAKKAAAVADNQDDDEEEVEDDQQEDGELEDEGLINEEDAGHNNQNPANEVDDAADHQNAADDDATAPDNGAADQLTAEGRLEQDGRGQPPRDTVVASVTGPKRPKKATAPVEDATGAVAVVDR